MLAGACSYCRAWPGPIPQGRPSGMIFSVIISEKGGAERRESFERAEINIGRVQGNELMLPKGNVSKRHARIVLRDGRFIVTDLKSTNGTYVNGRKIGQPTLVREGDKIYIGDFVLRVEAGPGAQMALGRVPSGEFNAVPDIGALDGPLSSPGGPPSVAQAKPRDGMLTGENAADVVSHFPLENDPDEAPVPVPAPPRVPRPTQSTKPSGSMLSPTALSPLPPHAHTAGGPPTLSAGHRPTAASSIPAPPQSPFPPAFGQAFPPRHAVPPGPTAVPPSPVNRTNSEPAPGPSTQHRAALATLVERVAESLDLAPLAAGAPLEAAFTTKIAGAIEERAAAMKVAGLVPEGVGVEQLVQEARRELIELGAIGPLLADDDVVEIHAQGSSRLVAFRKSRKQPTGEMPFTSEEAGARVLRRLAKRAGAELDAPGAVDLCAPDGSRLLGALPAAGAKGLVVVLRKPQRIEASTLEDLVRAGLLSRAVATLLSQGTACRANVLVAGPTGSGHGSLVAALAQGFGPEERVVSLQDDDEIPVQHANVLLIPLGPSADAAAGATRVAARMRPDRIVIGALAGATASELIGALGEGASSVLAAARAPTLRHALARLTADLVSARPGTTVEAAREALASTFDLALEVARLRDGRARLMRVADLRVEAGALVARDIFTFTIERTAAGGAIEGSLHATGAIPAIAEDLAARGTPVDPAIFRRAK
ncbi:ATPase, T2SS/T4P/T4SS family [Polyangium spumosum]|uniref:FHA domain-containing protein n=1 Tax=Polyangium spumosum TaxID=889282 RepID=A0A6N7PFN1_9BACT|nr:ATPase, T2SS/T4P/T4SS family [Polyangium spumosum]MRG90912.1 FHA domain-containing protein [Polyangium spumosum]